MEHLRPGATAVAAPAKAEEAVKAATAGECLPVNGSPSIISFRKPDWGQPRHPTKQEHVVSKA